MSGLAFDDLRRWVPACLAALFAGSGALHLARPGLYLPLVPPVLPARDGIVLASGVAELACAAGLLMHARWAGLTSARAAGRRLPRQRGVCHRFGIGPVDLAPGRRGSLGPVAPPGSVDLGGASGSEARVMSPPGRWPRGLNRRGRLLTEAGFD